MKKIILIFATLSVLILSIVIIYTNDMQMNECLELRVPILTKRETIKLTSGNFFDDEEVRKIYLSTNQMKSIIQQIKKNHNWKNTALDEKLDERIRYYTREAIYNNIPNAKNVYWIFTNRSHGVKNRHSVDELLEDLYYAVSLGILDLDNHILYYYEYDR